MTPRKVTTDDPVDHVIRQVLPWRPKATYTECGLALHPGLPAIDRDQLNARYRDVGARRAQLMTCLTCYDCAKRWGTWTGDPFGMLQRELSHRSKTGDLFMRELRAIEALIAEHREEFDGYVEGLERTTSISSVRRTRRRRG